MSKMSKLRPGDEVTYVPNRNVDPVILTYVETMKNGLDRFFSSQFPTLEYHLAPGHDHIRPHDESYEEEIHEKYVAFRGRDGAKRQAYEILLSRRNANAKHK